MLGQRQSYTRLINHRLPNRVRWMTSKRRGNCSACFLISHNACGSGTCSEVRHAPIVLGESIFMLLKRTKMLHGGVGQVTDECRSRFTTLRGEHGSRCWRGDRSVTCMNAFVQVLYQILVRLWSTSRTWYVKYEKRSITVSATCNKCEV